MTATGPISGPPVLSLTPGVNFDRFDLAASGYAVEEFFISGTATSYKPEAELNEDGDWHVSPLATAPFNAANPVNSMIVVLNWQAGMKK